MNHLHVFFFLLLNLTSTTSHFSSQSFHINVYIIYKCWKLFEANNPQRKWVFCTISLSIRMYTYFDQKNELYENNICSVWFNALWFCISKKICEQQKNKQFISITGSFSPFKYHKVWLHKISRKEKQGKVSWMYSHNYSEFFFR